MMILNDIILRVRNYHIYYRDITTPLLHSIFRENILSFLLHVEDPKAIINILTYNMLEY